MKNRLRIPLTLTVKGPILTQWSEPGRYGEDAAMAQSEGHYCIPGTLIKGLLRESLEELNKAAGQNWPIEAWLGKKSANREEMAESFDPYRGDWTITDLKDPELADQRDAKLTVRIAIDEDRGSVKKGFLAMFEQPYEPGEKVTFTGEVRLFATEEEEKTILPALRAGLNWIAAVGSQRTVGFGQVDKFDLGAAQRLTPAEVKENSNAQQWRVTLRFKDPFCVTESRPRANTFEGTEVISGGVIKGAIARMLETTGGFASLRTNLAKIRFTHFVPEEDSARPKRMPLSLYVESSAVRYADADPVPPDGIGEAAFNVDWKKEQEDLAYKQHSWPQVKKELRVRTAIEGEKRKSEDEKLFAIRLVLPGEYVWSGVLDLPKSVEAERPAIIGQLRGLLQNEIWGIGKTKAAATVEISEVKAGDGPPPLAKDTSVRVVLQTPALLLNPDEIGHDTTPEDLLTLYQAAFGEGGGLKLVNFFHDLRLDGGDYLYGRFRKGKQYKPYLLTTPGSTFVFTVTDETNAEATLENWYSRGLPIPAGCKNFYCDHAPPKTATEDLWQYCPYVPENGFGEIRAESMEAVTHV